MGDSNSDLTQAARLARAAAALARAGVRAGNAAAHLEGGDAVAGLPSSAERAGPENDGRGDRRRGRSQTPPPPEDPQSVVPDADPEAVARAIVLRQLSTAPRSRTQLEKKLRQRGCEDGVAARVLDRMTEVGLVDDEAYAEMLVRSRSQTKGLSRTGLAHELRQHGIDKEIAEEALGGLGIEDERARAEQLVSKKLRTMHGVDPDTQARRLAGLLARKGYPGEIAWPVIRDAVNNAHEHRRD
ncbi:MAG: recombination regulator RecX [Intrasporangium sp.]|uniref:regulatory protein RecX n=1 Tax=Intrasporangium sp. TaxID=1925024 RepID=UPI0026497FA9|nr:regulatory protein RecX [Intrasporangium sp.]MDN5795352.1 recombination regulator RecX [Intrasporangium sp.]